MIMASPTWLAYAFATLMAAVAVYCVARLVVARRLGRHDEYDVDVSHALMAIAMMGMLVPVWNVLPNVLWQVVFALFLLWFVLRAITVYRRRNTSPSRLRDPHHADRPVLHAFMAFAMLDMYRIGMPVSALGSSGTSMSGGSHTYGNPLITLLIVVVLLGFALWDMDAVFSRSAPHALAAPAGVARLASIEDDGPPPRERPLLSPRLEVVSYAAMCITMAFSLVLIL